MDEEARHFHEHHLTETAQVVRRLLPMIDAITRRNPPSTSEIHADYRLVGCMVALTRQRESLSAAIKLSEGAMGHLAIGFIRPACEEYLWLKYLATLERQDANDVFLALGNSDVLRSLSAARAYIGDPALNKLGFPLNFLSTTEARLDLTRQRLVALRDRLSWDGKGGPSVKWIAEEVDELALYNYLYAASSRAVHFSAGEALRRTWFDASGRVTFEDVDHRVYLSDFALNQLADLAIKTFAIADEWLQDSGNNATPREFDAELFEPLKAYKRLPRVPLILPQEYEYAWKAPDSTRANQVNGS